ncbi:MAG TPA: Maf family protein, partial [Acidimicrobiales bacterium]|nr:Maf family protein [Acidimicrobiales bacterium]
VLARRKAEAVAGRVEPRHGLVVACDSLLEFDGQAWGKAGSPEEVVSRWTRLRGGSGRLHTGHVVMDVATGRVAAETDTAVVHFGQPTDREIEAYARTSESLEVAGPFTLEGRSAPWIDSIEGNQGTITGISLPVLRRLLACLDVEIVDLWP